MSKRLPSAEATEYPWWVIIDAQQCMRADAGRIANLLTGPFLSREYAEAELTGNKHRYGKHAEVWCLSGHRSQEWRRFCKEEV